MASRPREQNKGGATYRDAGVDIDAGNALVDSIAPLAARTKRAGVMGAIGGFGGLFDLKAAGYDDPVLVSATDGVGTKLKIAIECGRHDSIGIDLVAMCVNDLVVQGAEPLFFLDYFACGKLDPGVAEAVIAGVAKGCEQAGAALIGGETAEMPGMYAAAHYDLAGFAVGAVSRKAVLPRSDIEARDVIIGVASSGVHSNGFSLVRHVVSRAGIDWSDTAPFDNGPTLGESLLTPTQIYVKPALEAIRQTGGVKALAHITGGGLPENLPRVLPEALAAHIDLASLPVLDVFGWIADTGGIDDAEMLRTFNCGAGMVLVAAASDVNAIIDCFAAAGQQAFVLGWIEAREDGDPVQFDGALGVSS